MTQSPGPISDWVKTPDGELLLADELQHRIVIEGQDGGWRVAPGEFRYPRAIAVLESTAYVVDSWNHRVQAFHLPEWKPAFEFGGFFSPSGIAVVRGFVVIADTNNRRLSFHEPDGSLTFTYDLDGFPKRLEVNSDGFLVVHYDDGQIETVEY